MTISSMVSPNACPGLTRDEILSIDMVLQRIRLDHELMTEMTVPRIKGSVATRSTMWSKGGTGLICRRKVMAIRVVVCGDSPTLLRALYDEPHSYVLLILLLRAMKYGE